MENLKVRPCKAGEPSYVCYLQMKIYEEEYQFKGIFEHYLLASMAEFIPPKSESRLWVALDGEKIIGSIAMVKSEENTAQLRWFAVAPRYQGKGVGKKLMDVAMEFCQERHYTHIYLWTVDILKSARQLYKNYGFTLNEEKWNTEWIREPLKEERWDFFAPKEDNTNEK